MRAIENFKQFLELDQPFKQRIEPVSGYFGADIRQLSRLRGALLEYYALASREQRVRAYLEQYIELFALMIREAIIRGECREVDPRKTAISLDAMYEG
jgi:hypothetical protein